MVGGYIKTFAYLSNKNNEEYKKNALRVLDILFDKTDHNCCFTKFNFGRKKIQEHSQLHNALGCINVVEATTTILLRAKKKEIQKGIGTIMESIGGPSS
jgi:hypothetical protein